MRLHDYPLRNYAWNLWSIHAVAEGLSADRATEEKAVSLVNDVVEKYSDAESLDSDDIAGIAPAPEMSVEMNSTTFQDLLDWLPQDHKVALMKALRIPYFFEEFHEAANVYSPLAEDEIRLVTLHSSRHWFAKIRCSFHTTSLHDHPQYEVMSYTWSQGRSDIIWTNGHEESVMQNLHKILCNLRSVRSGDTTLWVDSICINQEDHSERYQQVHLMSSIFAEADEVAICFSETSELDIWALHIITDLYVLIQRANSGLQPAITDLQSILASKPTEDPYLAIRRLFEVSWWSRIWTVQESFLARKATLMYGSYSMSYETVDSMVLHARTVERLLDDVSRRPGFTASTLFSSKAWKTLQATTILRMRRKLGSNLTLIQLLYATRHHRMINKRDRFFSLFALAGLPDESSTLTTFSSILPHLPDYRLSVQEVILVCCRALVAGYRNLEHISYIPPSSRGTPSWTSDFSFENDDDDCAPLLESLELVARHSRNFNASGTFNKVHFGDCGVHTDAAEVLCIHGLLVELIESGGGRTPDATTLRTLEQSNVLRFCACREWFRTESGRYGLAARPVVSGDIVAVFPGGKVPYILREVSARTRNSQLGPEDVYEIVSDWYARAWR